MNSCNGCKWLMDNDWCDMNRYRIDSTNSKCPKYDASQRVFDHEYFYKLCEQYCGMYSDFKNNTSYMKEEGELFNYNETELLSYVFNDIQREIKFYNNIDLYENLNNKK